MEFDWDMGNILKITQRFSLAEIEEFFSQQIVTMEDDQHSENEPRLIAMGMNAAGRFMFVCYTVRQEKIRVISARYMHRKEVAKYEEIKKYKGPSR